MKKLLIIITLSILALDAFAQRRVSGYVVDNESGEPLIGARITEVSTENSTITDFFGRFELTTAKDITALKVSFVGFHSEIRAVRDTIITIRLVPDDGTPMLIVRAGYPRISTIIGVNSDIANSLYGLNFAQIFRGRFTYGFFAQTNFKQDYRLTGSVIFSRPIRHINFISLNYTHKSLSENIDFNFHNISVKGYAFLSPVGLLLSAEPAFQSLNNNNNFGLTLGLNRSFWLWNSWVRTLNIGLSAGYFSDYWTYSAGAHFTISRSFGLRLSYNRIDNYDFFNVGLTYRFRRW